MEGQIKCFENDKSKTYIVHRYEPKQDALVEEALPEYMNLFGMIFSMCGLMIKIKWCSWCAIFCALISFAHSRSGEDKQIWSSFMLSISSVVMTYLQNPSPLITPW